MRDDPTNGNVNRLSSLTQQVCEICLTRMSQASSEKDFAREAVSQHPEDIMTHIWLAVTHQEQEAPVLAS